MDNSLLCFTNCLLCIGGELVAQDLYFSTDTGLITPNYYYRADGVKRIDLSGKVVAPGFLDLHVNGMGGVHFGDTGTNGDGEEADSEKLQRVAEMEVANGVTGFWATVPTVEKEKWREILPSLKPRPFDRGATLLGAHVEGPYLNAAKRGAHNAAFLATPEETSPPALYGASNLTDTIKMITLAPELPGSTALIGQLAEEHPQIAISLGHSAASYEDGLAAVQLGARSLTHVFNTMNPLHHRSPGLAGLITTSRCWYSLIPDGMHVHPAVLTLAMRANLNRCMFVTDGLSLTGLEDGTYPPTSHVSSRLTKSGARVTLEGSDTLVGSCMTVDEAVRNVIAWTGCNLAEAVRGVSENVADMMGEGKRGRLEQGRRADFVVLSEDAVVEETWIGGKIVWKLVA